MVEKAPKSDLRPVGIMVTVNETAVKKGLLLQAHQLSVLGRAIIEEAKSRDLDPERFSLTDGYRLDITTGGEAVMGIETFKDEKPIDFVAVSVGKDDLGAQRFVINGTPSHQLGRLMINVCEGLGVDLTPTKLYKSPTERGVKSD